jgi:hypothetical protein
MLPACPPLALDPAAPSGRISARKSLSFLEKFHLYLVAKSFVFCSKSTIYYRT